MISPLFAERFKASGDDGGAYFLKQNNRTSKLWWYSEHPSLGFAHVYSGTLRRERGIDHWNGTFIDVPKGLACGSGDLAWRVELAFGSVPTIVRATNTTPFGGNVLVPSPPAAIPRDAGVARHSAGYVGSGFDNLTGVWIGDDKGTYYIREVSNTQQIAWVGEHPEASPPGEEPGKAWVNVLMGQRSGPFIRAEWCDVPKGEVNNEGTMLLMLEDQDTLIIREKTGGFGGNVFRRVETLEATLRFNSLTVVRFAQGWLESNEPYFYAIIALMDGRTVDLTSPERSSADLSRSFIAPKLGDSVSEGTIISLASLPPIKIPFRAVPGDTGTHPIIGVALRGAEQDHSNAAWRSRTLSDWLSTGGGSLNRAIQSGRPFDFREVNRWHVMFTWVNEDDVFGRTGQSFTFNELVALTGRSTNIKFDMVGPNERFVVDATLAVSGPRGTCHP